MLIVYNKYPYLILYYSPNDYTIKVTTKFKLDYYQKARQSMQIVE